MASINVRVETDIDVDRIVRKVEDNNRLWQYAATQWHRLYTPYVPMDTGMLTDTVRITPGQIEHIQPYARYQYNGRFRHKKTYHPRASRKWDKAAEPTQKKKLVESIQAYIDRGGINFDE